MNIFEAVILAEFVYCKANFMSIKVVVSAHTGEAAEVRTAIVKPWEPGGPTIPNFQIFRKDV